jgi:phosphoserine phosphatase
LNDLPLLKAVSDPVCVNPDNTLIKEAQANHWPIISLED